MLYLVTVRLKRDVTHDPRNKVTGTCPVGDETCTDQTGEHHTFLVESELGVEDVRTTYASQYHVTRIETAVHLEVL